MVGSGVHLAPQQEHEGSALVVPLALLPPFAANLLMPDGKNEARNVPGFGFFQVIQFSYINPDGIGDEGIFRGVIQPGDKKHAPSSVRLRRVFLVSSGMLCSFGDSSCGF